jgi:hypothetical protein
MVTNKSDSRGFITEGPFDGTVTTYLDNYLPKYELYQNIDGQTVSGANQYFVLHFHGDKVTRRSRMNTWNTSSHKFFPSALNQAYTFRVNFELSASGGNPIFHICFDQIGSMITGAGGGHVDPMGIHRQEMTVDVVKGNVGHSHYHGTFTVIVDEHLFASGAQFYAETDSNAVTIKSGTLLIKEG